MNINGPLFPDNYEGQRCYSCGCFIGKPNIVDGQIWCCKYADEYNNRGSRPNGYKPHWIE